jgi:hypothetical protein
MSCNGFMTWSCMCRLLGDCFNVVFELGGTTPGSSLLKHPVKAHGGRMEIKS